MVANLISELNLIKEVCEQCTQCDLAKTRTQVVFSAGVPNHKLMLIGEAPGFYEDQQGEPFVGKAGQLLDKILESVGLSRQKNIYICNTIKCRPPENRNPLPEEKAACREFLDAQLEILKPKIILLCGGVAVNSFIDTKLGITKLRGQWFGGKWEGGTLKCTGSASDSDEVKMMPIFHPSYLLRNQSREEGSPKWLMWQDIKEIKKAYDNL